MASAQQDSEAVSGPDDFQEWNWSKSKCFVRFLAILTLFLIAFTAYSEISLTLAWDPNPEPDIAFYTLYYGNGSGNYSYCTNTSTGTQTNITVKGLSENLPWYFAVTASNTSGMESDFSNEVSWNQIPVFSFTAILQTSSSVEGPWSNSVTLYSTNGMMLTNEQKFFRVLLNLQH